MLLWLIFFMLCGMYGELGRIRQALERMSPPPDDEDAGDESETEETEEEKEN